MLPDRFGMFSLLLQDNVTTIFDGICGDMNCLSADLGLKSVSRELNKTVLSSSVPWLHPSASITFLHHPPVIFVIRWPSHRSRRHQPPPTFFSPYENSQFLALRPGRYRLFQRRRDPAPSHQRQAPCGTWHLWRRLSRGAGL